jgi:hypothetical protein
MSAQSGIPPAGDPDSGPELTSLKAPGCYHAYLVRLWRDKPDIPWRVLVKEVQTARELYFADLEQLFLFFHQEIDDSAEGEAL